MSVEALTRREIIETTLRSHPSRNAQFLWLFRHGEANCLTASSRESAMRPTFFMAKDLKLAQSCYRPDTNRGKASLPKAICLQIFPDSSTMAVQLTDNGLPLSGSEVPRLQQLNDENERCSTRRNDGTSQFP